MFKRIVYFSILFTLMQGICYAYSDGVIAVVGNRPITKSLVEAVMKVFGEEDFQKAISFVIDSYIVLNYMESSNIQIPDREVEEIISRIKVEDIKEELNKLGMSYDEYKNFIKAKKIADQIFSELVGGAFITEQDMKKFYDQNEQDIIKLFERRFVYYIELIDEKSISDISVNDMKRIGWVRRGELMKQFDDTIFSLPNTGFISINSENGNFMFFVSQIHSLSFSELKDDLNFREFYIKRKYKEVFESWLESQKKKQQIKRKEN